MTERSGTPLGPVLRRSFESRFGAVNVETGDRFESIANGQALIANEVDLEPLLAQA